MSGASSSKESPQNRLQLYSNNVKTLELFRCGVQDAAIIHVEATERGPDAILFSNVLLKNLYNCIIIGVHGLMINVTHGGQEVGVVEI